MRDNNERRDINVENLALERFQRFPLNAYLTTIRTKGRGGVNSDHRRRAAELFEDVRVWRQTYEPVSIEMAKTLELAEAFLWGEHFLQHNEAPKYRAYSSMPVLDLYLGVGRQLPAHVTFDRCRRAISLFVRDWLAFEQDAKLKSELLRYEARNFQIEQVNERIKRLLAFRTVTAFSEELPYIPKTDEQPHHKFASDWLYYGTAGDGALGLVHLTGLPQSTWHDEYMFLRTIHIAECCFWGAIVGVKLATQAYFNRDNDNALYGLREAAAFCSILVKLFSIFETMPISSFFDGFREATGDASAIQSQKYQELELLIRGLSRPKSGAIAKKQEVADYARIKLDRRYTLPGLLTIAKSRKRGEEIISAIERIHRSLMAWRSKHLGIARRYLPEDAKGTGEEGVPYLEENLRNPATKEARVKENDSTADFQVLTAMEIAAENCVFSFHKCLGVDIAGLKTALDHAYDEHKAGYVANKSKVSKRVDDYNRFFSSRRGESPLTSQLEKGFPGKSMRIEPRLLLTLELHCGVLMGVHDLGRVQLPILFDVAAGGETYGHISGKDRSCTDGEWVLRDKKGIFASYFFGPDARTKLNFQDKKVVDLAFFVFGYPDMDIAAVDVADDVISALVKPVSKHYECLRWSGFA